MASEDFGSVYEQALGLCQKDGATEEDLAKAFGLFKIAAEHDISDSKMFLAEMYRRGEGTERDVGKAVEILTGLAEAGNPDAQCLLASVYHKDMNDMREAFRWYSIAAEQGSAPAQLGLSSLYAKGEGTEADPDMAFAWMSKAAEQSDDGKIGLSMYYLNGVGTKKDESKAYGLLAEVDRERLKEFAVDMMKKIGEKQHRV